MMNRRGARVAARFWLQVFGMEKKASLRSGNVSTSGLYADLDGVGLRSGQLRTLYLASEDKALEVHVLARVVRVAMMDDLELGPVIRGAAFEFALADAPKRKELEPLVQRIFGAAGVESEGPTLSYGFAAELQAGAGPASQAASVPEIGRGGMFLETDWPVDEGETIRCDIRVPRSNRIVRVEGTAVGAQRAERGGEAKYRIEVRFAQGAGGTMEDTFTTLLADSLATPEASGARAAGGPATELAGTLGEISLPSLLLFFELERLTGVLTLEDAEDELRVHLRGGTIVDVESRAFGDLAPRERVRRAMKWKKARFRFALGPVERPDTFQCGTQALVFDLAREEDEASRDAQIADGDDVF